MKWWWAIAGALACASGRAWAEPCEVAVTWTLPLEVARVPGALEAQAALALWGPTASDGFEGALKRAIEGGVASRVAVDGRRVLLTMAAKDNQGCAIARALAADKKTAFWSDADRARVAKWDLDRFAATRGVREQALVGRAVAALDKNGSRRTEDPLPHGDGRARLVLAWALDDDGLAIAQSIVDDLGHPGGTLAERLLGSHGTADALAVVVTDDPPAFAVMVGTRDVKEAKDRILRELEAFEFDPMRPRPGVKRDAVEIERFVRRLPRLPPTELVRLAPKDDGALTADADSVLVFVAASIDLRCPAPGELRDSATLLEEKHGLDAGRYLALSRALGRDAERFQEIDLEIQYRCSERAKLTKLAPPAKVVSLYKVVRCSGGAEGEATRAAAFARAGLDPSTLRPLVALVRDQPRWTYAIEEIEKQCPEAP